jgi:alkaline phosphatase D
MPITKRTRRDFNVSIASASIASLPLISTSNARTQDAQRRGNEATGPMVGHVSSDTAHLWYRSGNSPGRYELIIHDANTGDRVQKLGAKADSDSDFCIHWVASDLKPSTRYRYTIARDGESIAESDDFYFETAPAAGTPSKVRLAFGSCAHMNPIRLWSDVEAAEVHGLVLLGDTPYIDSTDLAVARARHREFLSIEPLAKLIRHTPLWGTWDDHDFGANDSRGTLQGKENTRRAFIEYRANPDNGHDGQGIYSKFSYGPVDVWLLDTRWFSNTEPSPVDPGKPTLLGTRQWEWLLASLGQSTSPFKVLACGMIWDDKENRESDDWGTYPHEREALFRYLGENKIPGVVLIGGDIHCSRLLKYKTESICGYPIYQCIVSPIHDSVIPTLNVPHPDLVKGSATPHVWLQLDVDSTRSPATLRAEWIQMNGIEMWSLEVDAGDLTASTR